MDSEFYSVSTHPQCIEGIKLSGRHDRISIKAEYSSTLIMENDDKDEFEKIEAFLDSHQWKKHHISLIIPTEEVNFRTLILPFQDNKKIKQALPFEIENEIMEDIDDISYQYSTQALPDGTTKVFLSLIHLPYLEALKDLTAKRQLLIRNIDCSAHVLFRSVPLAPESNKVFQIYVGIAETFVNVIEDQQLQAVKTFPNRLASFLKEYPSLHSVGIRDFSEIIRDPNTILQNYPELRMDRVQGFSDQSREELTWLCTQLNLFLKTFQLEDSVQISMHGVFGDSIQWDGEHFSLAASGSHSGFQIETLIEEDEDDEESTTEDRSADTEEEQTVEAILSGLDELEGGTPANDNEEETPPSETPTSKISHEYTGHWGILGEIKKYGLEHFKGHELSFYTDSTQWVRFLRANRFSIFFSVLFFLLAIGGFGYDYLQQIQLLEKEIQITEQQVNRKLNRLLANAKPSSIVEGLALLEQKIIQKEEALQETRFQIRPYTNLEFIKKISSILPASVPLKITRLEFNDSRFSLRGVIDNYTNLQNLNSGISAMDEFKGEKLVQNNTTTSNGINFTISINRTQ